MDIFKSIIQFLLGLFKKSEGTKLATKVETENTIKEEPKQAPKEEPKEEPKQVTSTITVLNNSKGYSYFTQRNNEYQGSYACNCTSYCMMLLYNKLITRNKDGRWVNSKGEDLLKINAEWLPKKEFQQLEDNLMYFCQHNPDVLKCYSKNYSNLFADWIKERDEYSAKGIEESKRYYKNYPPNELHIVLTYAVNLFLNEGKDVVEYRSQSIDHIVKRLKNGESLTVSGAFEGLNHIVCVVGVQYEKETGKVLKFLIDDPWYRTLNYKSKKTGDDSVLTYDEFLQFVKPVNSLEKACHIVKR